MRYVVVCPCGATITRDSEDGAIDECCAHALDIHRMKLTREHALQMVSIVAAVRSPAGRAARRR